MTEENAVGRNRPVGHEGVTTEIVPFEIMMDKAEAQEKDRLLVALAEQFTSETGAIAFEMRIREGWKALEFKSWAAYCKSVDARVSRRFLDRAAAKGLVEKNLGTQIVLEHALQLSRIEDPEGQREVYAKVTKDFDNPIALNYETAVETWLIKHKESRRVKGQRGGAWVASDLEEDPELAGAFDKIQQVYGSADRKALQDGTVGWTRKDIVALTKFPVSKMKEVHYLIMEHHWNLTRCFKFRKCGQFSSACTT